MDKSAIPLTVYLAFLLAAGSADVAQSAELPKQITGIDDAPLLLVPAGEFVMGSAPGGYIFDDNETPRRLKVLRGGSWFNSRFLMRSAFRTGYAPYESNHGVGFRCARPAVVGVVERAGGE